jgi:hypothetical protein
MQYHVYGTDQPGTNIHAAERLHGDRWIWAATGTQWSGIASFTDVRELQRRLKAQRVRLEKEADESTTGPASFVAVDPDGNPILVDQHV